MKTLSAAITAVAALLVLSAGAFAQDEPQETHFIFGDDEIDGSTVTAGDITVVPRHDDGSLLVDVRLNFFRGFVRSVEEI